MPASSSQPVLPAAFLCAALADCEADDPVVQIAEQQLHSTQASAINSTGLAEALLAGPYASHAPEWLLEKAVALDLADSAATDAYDGSLDLAIRALGHPSCAAELRQKAVQQCRPQQLARLSRQHAPEVLAAAVAERLRAMSGGTSVPMTPELLEQPTAAQVVLYVAVLHDRVFEAARDGLPTAPLYVDPRDDEDLLVGLRQHRAAQSAWESMWRKILKTHTSRHRQLVEWGQDTPAGAVIRCELLASMPWDVEPDLLVELAETDLARFESLYVIARGCRMRRDEKASSQQILKRLTDELAQQPTETAKQLDDYLSGEVAPRLLDWGCQAPAAWAGTAARETWRHLLNPENAKDDYRPVHWRTPQPALAELAQRFATTAARALPYWEPPSSYSTIGPDDVTWLKEMLLHLPAITDDVKANMRSVIGRARAHIQRQPPRAYDDSRRAEEVIAAIERILADPSPATSTRAAALGPPDNVTIRALATASEHVLTEYLDRHSGNDRLVEKALLAQAVRGYTAQDDFAALLQRHTNPSSTLLRLTAELRRELGGGPTWRDNWTRLVLAHPDAGEELIRALPAWSALHAQGTRHRAAHLAVVAVARAALGDSHAAWERFASCPAASSGDAAWLRLGDLLDSAAAASSWPAPPAKR